MNEHHRNQRKWPQYLQGFSPSVTKHTPQRYSYYWLVMVSGMDIALLFLTMEFCPAHFNNWVFSLTSDRVRSESEDWLPVLTASRFSMVQLNGALIKPKWYLTSFALISDGLDTSELEASSKFHSLECKHPQCQPCMLWDAWSTHSSFGFRNNGLNLDISAYGSFSTYKLDVQLLQRSSSSLKPLW